MVGFVYVTGKLEQDDVVCVRRALMNYVQLMEDGALSGQQDPENDLWTDEYVAQEIERCHRLLNGAFKVTW